MLYLYKLSRIRKCGGFLVTHLTEFTLMSIKGLFFDYLSNEYLRESKSYEEYLVSSLHQAMQTEYVSLFKSENKSFVLLATTAGSYQSVPLADDNERVFLNNHEIELMLTDKSILIIKVNQSLYGKEFYEMLKSECERFLTYFNTLTAKTQNEAKYKLLYQSTEKFHTTMNKDEVLNQLITSLQTMFPEYLFYLFLSHDNENKQNLPIKGLDYEENNGNEKALEAYLTGNVQWEHCERADQLVLYAPLKGNQGVYGVVEVTQQNIQELNQDDLHFITSLAKAAGNALENAKLYEQSKKLVSDLQLINETSHQLNKNLRLNETMTYMSDRIMSSFSAQEVGFYYIDQSGLARILPGSTAFFHTHKANMYLELVKRRIQQDLEGLFIGEVQLNDHVDYSSLMAVPMIQSDQLKGFAIVLHQDSYYFTFETFKLVQSLIHHSTLALMNSMLREELEFLVKTDLTKLFSRNYLDEIVQLSLERDQQGTFILIDIDDFKLVNDTYGHQVGDDVLIQVAAVLKNNIRENDVGARWGGEELAIYLPQVDLPTGISVAARLVEMVRKLTEPTVTISCGVAHWNADRNDTMKKIVRRADKALYSAKESGKNRVIYQEDIEIML